MRQRLCAVLVLVVVGWVLAVVSPAAALGGGSGVAPSSVGAYTHATYIRKGTVRIINVKCHATGSYKGIVQGQTTEQVCGGNGWIDGVWVDADVTFHVRNDVTGNVTDYPSGYHGSVGGGSYNMWVIAVGGA